MASSSSTPTQSIMQEARILYLTRLTGQRWRFRALPISRTHLDSTPASAPSPIDSAKDPDNWERLCELMDELSRILAPNGEFEGWEIHLLENPVIIRGYYQAKILRLMRMEDSAAMREVRMVLEKGSPGFRS